MDPYYQDEEGVIENLCTDAERYRALSENPTRWGGDEDDYHLYTFDADSVLVNLSDYETLEGLADALIAEATEERA